MAESTSQETLSFNALQALYRKLKGGKDEPIEVPPDYQPGDAAAVIAQLNELGGTKAAEFLRSNLFVHENCAGCGALLTPEEFASGSDLCSKCK